MKILERCLTKKILMKIKLDNIIEVGNSLLESECVYLYYKGEEVGYSKKITIDFDPFIIDDNYDSILKLLHDIRLCINIDKNDFYDKDMMYVDEIKIFEVHDSYTDKLLYDKKLHKNHIMKPKNFKNDKSGIKNSMTIRFGLELD